MTDDATFLSQLAVPGSGPLRRVYADWLLERGDLRGQYLNLGLALAEAPPADQARLRSELRKVRARLEPAQLAPLEQPATLAVNPTPFEPWWWSVDLGEQRPNDGTYGRWPYATLPPLPVEGLDAFALMPRTAKASDEPYSELSRTERALAASGLSLPASFLHYFGPTGPWDALRSCTDCWYSFGQPVAAPGGDGTLLRFYSDSQSCIHWYLFLSPEGDHCVVAGEEESEGLPDHDFDDEDEDELGDGTHAAKLLAAIEAPAAPGPAPEPAGAPVIDASFAAPSFEAFVVRFWLENEIWFKRSDHQPLSATEEAYLAHYRR